MQFTTASLPALRGDLKMRYYYNALEQLPESPISILYFVVMGTFNVLHRTDTETSDLSERDRRKGKEVVAHRVLMPRATLNRLMI